MNNLELTKNLQTNYNIVFSDASLLEQAFTHSSYVNEHRYMMIADNERLEFLGDAVLELIVSELLFSNFPELPEGKLTKMRAAIVCEDSLSKLAKDCSFDEYVQLGKGEANSNGKERPALLCDLFEAFLGALYLDKGYESVKDFLEIVLFPQILDGQFSGELDYKTTLQEYLQRNGDTVIEYYLVSEVGPAHDRDFHVAVKVRGETIGEGIGKSKKSAEQQAAQTALDNFHKK